MNKQTAKGRGIGRFSLAGTLPMYAFTLLFVIGPLVYLFVLSLYTRQEAGVVLPGVSLANYARILDKEVLLTFWESIKLALIVTLLVALIGYPFGYFMARLSIKARRVMMLVIMVPFWVSSLLRLYGWIIFFRANGPLDMLLMGTGLRDEPLRMLYTYPAVLWGMVYALLPFMIFAVFSSAEKLDRTLIEAARDMGATKWQAFFTVSFRLIMPGLLSGVVLTFVPSMGLFFIEELLGGSKNVLVGTLINSEINLTRNLPFAAALCVVLIVLTSLMLFLYRLVTRAKDLEGLV